MADDVKKIYERDFDGVQFAERYCSAEWAFCNQWFMEEFYHRLFTQGKLRGKTLIDIGCGPTLRAPLIAGRYGCEVVCADFLETNCQFVQNWLEKGHAAFDFSKQFQHVAELEGNDDIGYLEERVKKCVKDVIFCDFLADNPVHPRPLEQFDIATTSLSLDCYADRKDYFKGAEGISRLVRPGGFLALGGCLDSCYYTVGDKVLPSANVNADTTKKALTAAGFKVLEVTQFFFQGSEVDTDNNGFCTIYAIKL